MDFKLWLENDERGAFAWYKDQPHRWYDYQIGAGETFSVYVDKNVISVNGGGPYHPLMKRAIKSLIKQKPMLLNRKLDFDGFSPGSVQDFLKTPDFHGPKDRLPKFLYHGTSYFKWEKIREEGLQPRNESGEDPTYGAKYNAPPGQAEHIYFGGSPNASTRWAAQEAQRDGSNPVAIQVDSSGLDYSLLRPDHDSGSNTWQESLARMDTIAYEGSVAPQYLRLYKVYRYNGQQPGTWEDPGDWLEPNDFLAQQMRDLHNKKGYTPIPDSTSSYKWVKL